MSQNSPANGLKGRGGRTRVSSSSLHALCLGFFLFTISALPVTTASATTPPPPIPAATISAPHRLSLPGVSNLAMVDTGIYRSARPTAAGYDSLRRLGVRTIINLERYSDDGEALRRAGIVNIHIPLSVMRRPTDTEAERFLAAVTDTSLRPLLIHCLRGIDRTGAMVALYRTRVQGWAPQHALDEMAAFGYIRAMFPRMAEFVLEQDDPIRSRPPPPAH